MFGALLAGFIIFIFFKVVTRGTEDEVDYFLSTAVAMIPWIINGGASFFSAYLGLPEWLPLLALPFYFIVPLLMLRNIMEFSWKVACLYALLIAILVISCQYGLAFIIQIAMA